MLAMDFQTNLILSVLQGDLEDSHTADVTPTCSIVIALLKPHMLRLLVLC